MGNFYYITVNIVLKIFGGQNLVAAITFLCKNLVSHQSVLALLLIATNVVSF